MYTNPWPLTAFSLFPLPEPHPLKSSSRYIAKFTVHCSSIIVSNSVIWYEIQYEIQQYDMKVWLLTSAYSL